MKWKCLKEEILFKTRIMDLIAKDCISPDGSKNYRFFTLSAPEWANIIPVTDDGKVILVKQYRPGIDQVTAEVPGGVMDLTDQHFQEGALRELEEETGYSPISGARVESLGWAYPNPATHNNRVHFFIAGPVQKKKVQKLDYSEEVEVLEVPIAEIPNWIAEGKISHSLILNGFLALLMKSQEGKSALVNSLTNFSKNLES